MRFRFLSFVALLAALVCAAESATYYVDYDGGNDANAGTSTGAAWQRSPGMTGFSGSYSHSAGDEIIFKGGVTWPASVFPLVISNSGAGVGSEDRYRSDPSWYSGGEFAKPVFDGENTFTAATYIIHLSEASYVSLSGIKIIDIDTEGEGARNSGAIRAFNGCREGIIIDDMEIVGYSSHCIVLHYNNHTAITNGFRITNCSFSHVANFIESGVSLTTSNLTVDGITIVGNEFFDPHTQLADGDHGDGIHLFTSGGQAPIYTDVLIASNKWYGDWSGYDDITSNTGVIYFENIVYSAWIYNNYMTFSNTNQLKPSYLFSPSPFATDIYGEGAIYNNTIDGSQLDATEHGSKPFNQGISSKGGGDVAVSGNIIINALYGLNLYNKTGGTAADYNIVYDCTNYGVTQEGGQQIHSTLTNWRNNTVHGDNSLTSDPALATPGSVDTLQSESPAIDAFPTASAPTNLFVVDILGFSRPSGSAWDIGAYEFDQGDLWPNVPDSPPNRIWIGVP